MRVKSERAARYEPIDDAQLKWLLQQSQSGQRTARDQLVQANLRLVWSVVQRFIHRGYDPEDLFQIGCIGLMKAIDKFDFSYHVKFSTYAVPMIIGEIQRFLRDDGTVKVSRSLKELAQKIKRGHDQWMASQGTTPTMQQLADLMQVDVEDIILALSATRLPSSIDETIYENEGDPILLIDQLADEQQDNWFDRFSLQEAMSQLTDREKQIVSLRYYKDLTQSQVAKIVGISQVQVSRLEKKILHQLRERMEQKNE